MEYLIDMMLKLGSIMLSSRQLCRELTKRRLFEKQETVRYGLHVQLYLPMSLPDSLDSSVIYGIHHAVSYMMTSIGPCDQKGRLRLSAVC